MSKRIIHIDNKEWKYIIGQHFVKINAPDGKTSAVPKADIFDAFQPVREHDCSNHMDEAGQHYEYQCLVCMHGRQLNPASIKEYIKAKLI